MKPQIRILHILSAQYSDPILCNRHAVPLYDNPTYEALSYSWGDPYIDHIIELGGQQATTTDNLCNALQRVRFVHQTRNTWADALCVNQVDKDPSGWIGEKHLPMHHGRHIVGWGIFRQRRYAHWHEFHRRLLQQHLCQIAGSRPLLKLPRVCVVVGNGRVRCPRCSLESFVVIARMDCVKSGPPEESNFVLRNDIPTAITSCA